MHSKAYFIPAIVLCAAALLFSGYQVSARLIATHQAQEQFAGAAAQIESPASSVPPTTPGASSIPVDSEPVTPPAPVWTVYDQYGTLFDANPAMIGWIKIDGTAIDYPVMQTDNNSYYLSHGLDGTASKHGVPFVDYRCDIYKPSGNITIYGHHMGDGTMFNNLEKYKSKDFFLAHPMIEFDTRAGFGEYQIIAVFKVNPARFPYQQFADGGQAAFDAYVNRCMSLSLYDTGYTATYGDKLITLSTCEYSAPGNRLAVVAKRVSP